MVTCFRCAKIIRGEMVVHNPPNYLIRMGVDFMKSFHPSCYKESEKEAEKELNKESVHQANTALIAAAPDLLEASKVALSCLEYRAEQTNRKWTVADQNAFDKLKKAISKAEGRTE